MTDRTANTQFFPSIDPSIIRGVVNASDGDSFKIPYGELQDCFVSNQDDDDIIVSADTSGSVVTLGCVTDAGGAHGTDIDIVFEAILKDQ